MRSDIFSTNSTSIPARVEKRRPNIRSLFLGEIGEWVATKGFEPYRASQLAGWFYNRAVTAVDSMHNLPAELRSELTLDFECDAPTRLATYNSVDGTSKLLVGLRDGVAVESVLIPRETRLALCLSSQVGCAMGCDYCATATLGLRRNLEPFEIVVQVLRAREVAGEQPITNYVFMGMGEPLANYDRLVRALRIMTARWGLGISPRRITVSTVGLLPQLERLVKEVNVNVAVSLTAATDDLRDRLMPVNLRYPLADLVQTCRRLELPQRKRITFEYVMLDGVNDGAADAGELIRLFQALTVKVNLIPFNAFAGTTYRCSTPARVSAFQRRLLDAGIHTTVRSSRGQDIMAACGQLVAERQRWPVSV